MRCWRAPTAVMPSFRPSASAVCGPADFSACKTRSEPRCFMATTLARLRQFEKYLLFKLWHAKRDGLNKGEVPHAAGSSAALDRAAQRAAFPGEPLQRAAAQARQARSLYAAALSAARH